MTSGMPYPWTNDDKGRGPPVGRTESRRLVLVDDEDEAATSCLARLLAAAGDEVQVAHDDATAAGLARWGNPEVFLPGSAGYRRAERLRGDEGCEEALFIAVSGHDRRGLRGPEFDDYLVKPLHLESLLASIVDSRPVHPTNGANLPTSREEDIIHEE